MQGQVLSFDAVAGGGIILGDDGRRYNFAAEAWKGSHPPQAFQRVDYLAAATEAREVCPLNDPHLIAVQVPPANASRLLGWLGVGALILGFVVPLVPMIAALILGLIAADIGKRHGDRTGVLLGRIAWVGAVVILALAVALIAVGLDFLTRTLVPVLERTLHPATGLAV